MLLVQLMFVNLPYKSLSGTTWEHFDSCQALPTTNNLVQSSSKELLPKVIK